VVLEGQSKKMHHNSGSLNAVMSGESTTTRYGVPAGSFSKLVKVAQGNNCTIIIRTTNPGVILGVENKYVAGKPLMSKPKSCNALFLEARLPICPYLAKNFPLQLSGAREQDAAVEKEFVNKAAKAQKSLFADDFAKGPFKPINAYTSLRIESAELKKTKFEYTFQTGIKNDSDVTKIEFRVEQSGGKTLLIPSEIFEKPSTATTEKLKIHYLLKELPQSEYANCEEKLPLSLIPHKDERIFQVHVSFENEEYNKSFAGEKGVKFENRDYYPVKVIGEKCSWTGKNESDFGKYFPIVADYDLFAVAAKDRNKIAATIEAKGNDYFVPTYSPILKKDWDKWLDKDYDISLRSITKNAELHKHLGILSPFENDVRRDINAALGLPMARHGCEVNNVIYTSSTSDIEQTIEVSPESKANRTGGFPRSSFTDSYANNRYLTSNPAWYLKQAKHNFCSHEDCIGDASDVHAFCWKNRIDAQLLPTSYEDELDLEDINNFLPMEPDQIWETASFLLNYYEGLKVSLEQLAKEDADASHQAKLKREIGLLAEITKKIKHYSTPSASKEEQEQDVTLVSQLIGMQRLNEALSTNYHDQLEYLAFNSIKGIEYIKSMELRAHLEHRRQKTEAIWFYSAMSGHWESKYWKELYKISTGSVLNMLNENVTGLKVVAAIMESLKSSVANGQEITLKDVAKGTKAYLVKEVFRNGPNSTSAQWVPFLDAMRLFRYCHILAANDRQYPLKIETKDQTSFLSELKSEIVKFSKEVAEFQELTDSIKKEPTKSKRQILIKATNVLNFFLDANHISSIQVVDDYADEMRQAGYRRQQAKRKITEKMENYWKEYFLLFDEKPETLKTKQIKQFLSQLTHTLKCYEIVVSMLEANSGQEEPKDISYRDLRNHLAEEFSKTVLGKNLEKNAESYLNTAMVLFQDFHIGFLVAQKNARRRDQFDIKEEDLSHYSMKFDAQKIDLILLYANLACAEIQRKKSELEQAKKEKDALLKNLKKKKGEEQKVVDKIFKSALDKQKKARAIAEQHQNTNEAREKLKDTIEALEDVEKRLEGFLKDYRLESSGKSLTSLKKYLQLFESDVEFIWNELYLSSQGDQQEPMPDNFLDFINIFHPGFYYIGIESKTFANISKYIQDTRIPEVTRAIKKDDSGAFASEKKTLEGLLQAISNRTKEKTDTLKQSYIEFQALLKEQAVKTLKSLEEKAAENIKRKENTLYDDISGETRMKFLIGQLIQPIQKSIDALLIKSENDSEYDASLDPGNKTYSQHRKFLWAEEYNKLVTFDLLNTDPEYLWKELNDTRKEIKAYENLLVWYVEVKEQRTLPHYDVKACCVMRKLENIQRIRELEFQIKSVLETEKKKIKQQRIDALKADTDFFDHLFALVHRGQEIKAGRELPLSDKTDKARRDGFLKKENVAAFQKKMVEQLKIDAYDEIKREFEKKVAKELELEAEKKIRQEALKSFTIIGKFVVPDSVEVLNQLVKLRKQELLFELNLLSFTSPEYREAYAENIKEYQDLHRNLSVVETQMKVSEFSYSAMYKIFELFGGGLVSDGYSTSSYKVGLDLSLGASLGISQGVKAKIGTDIVLSLVAQLTVQDDRRLRVTIGSALKAQTEASVKAIEKVMDISAKLGKELLYNGITFVFQDMSHFVAYVTKEIANTISFIVSVFKGAVIPLPKPLNGKSILTKVQKQYDKKIASSQLEKELDELYSLEMISGPKRQRKPTENPEWITALFTEKEYGEIQKHSRALVNYARNRSEYDADLFQDLRADEFLKQLGNSKCGNIQELADIPPMVVTSRNFNPRFALSKSGDDVLNVVELLLLRGLSASVTLDILNQKVKIDAVFDKQRHLQFSPFKDKSFIDYLIPDYSCSIIDYIDLSLRGKFGWKFDMPLTKGEFDLKLGLGASVKFSRVQDHPNRLNNGYYLTIKGTITLPKVSIEYIAQTIEKNFKIGLFPALASDKFAGKNFNELKEALIQWDKNRPGGGNLKKDFDAIAKDNGKLKNLLSEYLAQENPDLKITKHNDKANEIISYVTDNTWRKIGYTGLTKSAELTSTLLLPFLIGQIPPDSLADKVNSPDYQINVNKDNIKGSLKQVTADLLKNLQQYLTLLIPMLKFTATRGLVGDTAVFELGFVNHENDWKKIKSYRMMYLRINSSSESEGGLYDQGIPVFSGVNIDLKGKYSSSGMIVYKELLGNCTLAYIEIVYDGFKSHSKGRTGALAEKWRERWHRFVNEHKYTIWQIFCRLSDHYQDKRKQTAHSFLMYDEVQNRGEHGKQFLELCKTYVNKSGSTQNFDTPYYAKIVEGLETYFSESAKQGG
jgi:hypothetical protein